MFKVCSWNICMQDYNYKWRIDLICDKILNENPDVICFQEVISSFFDIIKKNYQNIHRFFQKFMKIIRLKELMER